MEKQKLPHSQAALILGITSIVTACCCYGFIGVILGFIGMSEAKKAKAIHEKDPELYKGLNNAETGRTTSIIGLVIGGIITLLYIFLLATGRYGEMMEQYQDMLLEMQN